MAEGSTFPGACESPAESDENPVAGTGLEVDIARIQPYEHNPRHSPNPEYDRIRDSIRNQGRISQMEYAVYRLLPLIPRALEHGMGRPQVERIRRLEQVADTVWCQRCPDEAGKFEPVFVALCSRYDGPDWNTDLLREALETTTTSPWLSCDPMW